MRKINVKIENLTLYVNAETERVRLGYKNKVQDARAFINALPKSARRAVRKALYKAGHRRLAGLGIHS